MSGEFGTTAWGRDWLRLAEPTTITRPNPALPRARSLARNDRVRDVGLRPGRITATVHDKGHTYRVSITLPTWDPSRLAAARTLLARESADAPAGADLPDDVHAALTRAGLSPAPGASTLDAGCDCPGRIRPCRHLLAVYFEVTRRLDEQPHQALTLRGLPLPATPRQTTRIPLPHLDPAHFYTRPA